MDNEILRIIGANTRDVISIFDSDFQRIFVSESVFDLTGYTVAEILAMGVNAPIPEEDLERVQPVVLNSLAEGRECLVEHRLRCKDGRLIWTEVLVRPIFENRSLKWILTSARNITDRKEKEAALEKEKRITESLLNVAIISHEIRNPLSALIRASEMLLNETDLRSQRSVARVMRVSGELLMNIVNNVLVHSKILNRDVAVIDNPVHLNSFFGDIFSVYKLLARQKGLRFETKFQGSLGWAGLDSGKLSQVVSNILDNALKFTTRGSIGITIESLQSDSGSTLSLSVADTGPGFPDEARERIFEPFSHHVLTSMHKQGVGLGLYVVKNLLDSLGGNIAINSSNAGTEVVIQIPYRPIEIPKRSRGRKLSKLDMKVLIVEDAPAQQFLLLESLIQYGAHCEAVDTFKDAEVKIMSDMFDIVIVDIHNPSDQPGSAASFIRKFSATTQILVLSGYADDVARNELLHAGATNVFLKTEPLRHLISALSQIKKKPGKKNLPWDLGIYRHLFRADREKYDHAILLLKDELQAFIGSAGEHVASQDASLLIQDLHRLIPISRQLKFTVLTDLLASCYQSAEQHHWDEIRNAFPRIKQLIERFLSFV